MNTANKIITCYIESSYIAMISREFRIYVCVYQYASFVTVYHKPLHFESLKRKKKVFRCSMTENLETLGMTFGKTKQPAFSVFLGIHGPL